MLGALRPCENILPTLSHRRSLSNETYSPLKVSSISKPKPLLILQNASRDSNHMDVQIENQPPSQSLRLSTSNTLKKRRSLTTEQKTSLAQTQILSPSSISFSPQFKSKKDKLSEREQVTAQEQKGLNRKLNLRSSMLSAEDLLELEKLKAKAKELAILQIQQSSASTENHDQIRNLYDQLWKLNYEKLLLQKTQLISKTTLSNKLTEIKQRMQALPLSRRIKIDAKLLNYGKYFSGRVLGSTIVITNRQTARINLRIKVDDSSFFSFNKITEHCADIAHTFFSDFPINLLNLEQEFEKGFVENSQPKFQCWSLECSESRQCVKFLEIALEPKESREIVVVHRSPSSRQEQKLIAFLNIQDLEFQSKDPNGNHTLHVMLMGKIETPRLLCQKVLKDAPSGISLIKLALKPNQHLQRFKIPFKNMCELEYELDFQNWSPEKSNSDQGFEYSFLQNQIKIPARSTIILTLVVKNTHISQSGVIEAGKDTVGKTGRSLRMLVARVKDSNISFKFMIECEFIPRI